MCVFRPKVAAAFVLLVVLPALACRGGSIPEGLAILTIPGTDLWFPREEADHQRGRALKDALGEGVLTLAGRCLRLGGEDGALIIWPPEFTPHLSAGVVEIQDEEGRVVAKVGDTVQMAGGQGPEIDGPCPGPTFEDAREIRKEERNPDERVAFPTHHGRLGTNLGFDYLAGELRLEDGCLKLYRLGWEDPDRTVDEQLRDIWLPVWPEGFTLSRDTVLDGDGETVARAGDVVRLGGRGSWPSADWQQEMQEGIPEACRVIYYLVGDEVSVVSPDEERIVSLPGSSLWFPRTKTSGAYPQAQLLVPPPDDTTLVLDGDCLRVGDGGPVVIWPAGFYPDWEDGHIVVRNGGGRVVAVVGEEMDLGGGGYVNHSTGPCQGPLWVSTVFQGTLPETPAR